MKIKSVDLSKAEFAPYGKILTLNDIADFTPLGEGDDFTWTGTSEEFAIGGAGCSGMLLCRPRKMAVEKMEHHVGTVEILVAVEQDYVLCVAPKCVPEPEMDKVKAFKVKQGTVLMMDPGCWHWIPFPMAEKMAKVLVIFKDKTGDEDLVFADLPEVVEIEH